MKYTPKVLYTIFVRCSTLGPVLNSNDRRTKMEDLIIVAANEYLAHRTCGLEITGAAAIALGFSFYTPVSSVELAAAIVVALGDELVETPEDIALIRLVASRITSRLN